MTKRKPKCKKCKGWGISNIIDYRIEECPVCGIGREKEGGKQA